ncbi:hypothetical protein [Mastigocoleus sp. MO_188.B34]|uniref:hypothetical protein n=1 Tax=Mastigocoleus sp. MO_188.B34 TaxID=3036635 RepID=UPI002603EDE3|nr:hypothetical protein [Mastigocoleus sp. MO_188.B34]MDJ0696147.1 hypothetical protein [Mastigocoleus sp. MO_188.B34]
MGDWGLGIGDWGFGIWDLGFGIGDLGFGIGVRVGLAIWGLVINDGCYLPSS